MKRGRLTEYDVQEIIFSRSEDENDLDLDISSHYSFFRQDATNVVSVAVADVLNQVGDPDSLIQSESVFRSKLYLFLKIENIREDELAPPIFLEQNFSVDDRRFIAFCNDLLISFDIEFEDDLMTKLDKGSGEEPPADQDPMSYLNQATERNRQLDVINQAKYSELFQTKPTEIGQPFSNVPSLVEKHKDNPSEFKRLLLVDRKNTNNVVAFLVLDKDNDLNEALLDEFILELFGLPANKVLETKEKFEELTRISVSIKKVIDGPLHLRFLTSVKPGQYFYPEKIIADSFVKVLSKMTEEEIDPEKFAEKLYKDLWKKDRVERRGGGTPVINSTWLDGDDLKENIKYKHLFYGFCEATLLETGYIKSELIKASVDRPEKKEPLTPTQQKMLEVLAKEIDGVWEIKDQYKDLFISNVDNNNSISVILKLLSWAFEEEVNILSDSQVTNDISSIAYFIYKRSKQYIESELNGNSIFSPDYNGKYKIEFRNLIKDILKDNNISFPGSNNYPKQELEKELGIDLLSEREKAFEVFINEIFNFDKPRLILSHSSEKYSEDEIIREKLKLIKGLADNWILDINYQNEDESSIGVLANSLSLEISHYNLQNLVHEKLYGPSDIGYNNLVKNLCDSLGINYFGKKDTEEQTPPPIVELEKKLEQNNSAEFAYKQQCFLQFIELRDDGINEKFAIKVIEKLLVKDVFNVSKVKDMTFDEISLVFKTAIDEISENLFSQNTLWWLIGGEKEPDPEALKQLFDLLGINYKDKESSTVVSYQSIFDLINRDEYSIHDLMKEERHSPLFLFKNSLKKDAGVLAFHLNNLLLTVSSWNKPVDFSAFINLLSSTLYNGAGMYMHTFVEGTTLESEILIKFTKNLLELANVEFVEELAVIKEVQPDPASTKQRVNSALQAQNENQQEHIEPVEIEIVKQPTIKLKPLSIKQSLFWPAWKKKLFDNKEMTISELNQMIFKYFLLEAKKKYSPSLLIQSDKFLKDSILFFKTNPSKNDFEDWIIDNFVFDGLTIQGYEKQRDINGNFVQELYLRIKDLDREIHKQKLLPMSDVLRGMQEGLVLQKNKEHGTPKQQMLFLMKSVLISEPKYKKLFKPVTGLMQFKRHQNVMFDFWQTKPSREEFAEWFRLENSRTTDPSDSFLRDTFDRELANEYAGDLYSLYFARENLLAGLDEVEYPSKGLEAIVVGKELNEYASVENDKEETESMEDFALRIGKLKDSKDYQRLKQAFFDRMGQRVEDDQVKEFDDLVKIFKGLSSAINKNGEVVVEEETESIEDFALRIGKLKDSKDYQRLKQAFFDRMGQRVEDDQVKEFDDLVKIFKGLSSAINNSGEVGGL